MRAAMGDVLGEQRASVAARTERDRPRTITAELDSAALSPEDFTDSPRTARKEV